MRLALVLAALLALCDSALAVSPDDVLQWTKAGVADEEIIARIRKDPPPNRLTAEDALRLKSAGVSDVVLKALVEAGAPPTEQPPPTEPSTETPSEPRPIATVDDIIDAHVDGMPATDLATRVRGRGIKVRRSDLERMRAVGVPELVISAARSTRSSDRAPAPGRREQREDRFGDAGTMTLELAGGFGSVSRGDVEVSGGRLVPAVHRLVASVLSLGLEADFTFGTGGMGQSNFFGVVGVAIPSESLLFRIAARGGGGSRGAAYGFQAVILGRGGRLLAGVGVNATWAGDPTATLIGIDFRLGTWF